MSTDCAMFSDERAIHALQGAGDKSKTLADSQKAMSGSKRKTRASKTPFARVRCDIRST